MPYQDRTMPSRPATVTFSQVAGSPFALSDAWTKAATVTPITRGLRIAPLADASAFDIEWVSVPAGSAAPTDPRGEPIFGGEDFAASLPLGDIYLRSPTNQVAIVKLGA